VCDDENDSEIIENTEDMEDPECSTGDGDMQDSQETDTDEVTGSEPSPSASSSNTSTSYKKRASKRSGDNTVPVKELSSLAVSASKALLQLSNKRETSKKTECNDKTDDKDWMLAMLLYRKLKEIPDGDDKDELHVELQRMVNQTRRAIVNRPACAQPYISYEAPTQASGVPQFMQYSIKNHYVT